MLWKRKKFCVRPFLNHGYEPQSKLWKYFAFYPPLSGIIRPASFRHFVSEVWVSLQLNNSNALRFWNCSFTNKGTILITLIVTMLIFSILAVAMLSLTSTSMFSQLNTSSTTKATYIAKSGYNYLASYYKNTVGEVQKNDALENLHSTNFNLLKGNGSFLLNVEPSYLKSLETKPIDNNTTTLNVKFPGAVSYPIPSSATVNQTMAVYTGPGTGTGGYQRFYYRTVTINSPNNFTLNLSTTHPPDGTINVVFGDSIVPVLTTPGNNQTLNNTNHDYLTVTGASAIYPLRFGFFEIPQIDTSNVYYYDYRTGNIFYGIRDARDKTRNFTYTINNRRIYAHTFAAITSTGTFNPGGSSTTSNTFSRTAILGYTPGGNSGSATPDGYTWCANENNSTLPTPWTCTFTGTKHVAYGANGSYYYRDATGSILCDNSIFGDPLVGTEKRCYYK